ncbi:hypothetical protein [Rubinisphaera sp.]|uniref:hypothetical protein n=1 Tax=Rubinisphaera sp. TaxID=2024857 RepID=UPI000C10B632|nr:hypothetical protein [Rubinisphaera sp.]MBV12404.1 hypothetical protein [Rubinisphaera sp.]HCS50097.1 hypothetical protein [Planctomycetaceae bacterium]|tara:strand:- start:15686 stop:16174 length:489 start_codon:yes stop_codon:yes gene_type:complete
MAREAIEFGRPEVLKSGKVRYKKMVSGSQFKSPAYDLDSRRNRADAWNLFLKFRDEVLAEIAAKQAAHDAADPIRSNLVEHLQDEIALAEITQNKKQSKWASNVLEIVRNADPKGLDEAAEILGIPNKGEEPLHFVAAREVVKLTIKNAKPRLSDSDLSAIY